MLESSTKNTLSQKHQVIALCMQSAKMQSWNNICKKAINKELEKQKIYGDDLKIYCEIAHYDEGNRALRYFVSFGAGSATSMIRNDLIDTENNESLNNRNTNNT
ncbi:DUF4410 domain-containing protein [Campylobacter hyointestinalis]|uniref:DUF4410 domain-containing protein n=1 Tax=Campylobacter hyointestinalis TaxID=198 RepID=A0A562XCH7_CAMHY|nr:DUF4410 domain-containing protein [Campylobacter hyointestinalis]TWO19831.1 DUF4410 domain-containing protein [Campylobacter hyointestinalis]